MIALPLNQPQLSGVQPFVFETMVPLAIWNINHGLNRPVHVTLLDLAGEQVWAKVIHVDLNNVQVIFGDLETGRANII